MRRGFTLVELAMTLTVLLIVLVLVGKPAMQLRDRLAVESAVQDVVGFYQTARLGALTRATRVRVEIGTDSLLAVLEGAVERALAERRGPDRHGVSLSSTRPVIWIHPTGVGAGGANTTIILRRGTVAESLFTSRLGRLRRGS